jgi:hypothetical protein
VNRTLPNRFLLVLLSMAPVGCSSVSPSETPPAESLTQVMRGEGPLTLLEGFPHQGFERELLEREKAKPHRTIAGFHFYEEPLPISASDARVVRDTLAAESALEPFSGEKKCGGFHPDYAVDIQKDGAPWQVLICFGCGEARVLGASGDTRHDLSRPAQDALEKALRPYRKNRPVTE